MILLVRFNRPKIFDIFGTCQMEVACSIVVEWLLDVYAREVRHVFLLREIKYPLTDMVWCALCHIRYQYEKEQKILIEFLELGKASPLDNIENWPSKSGELYL